MRFLKRNLLFFIFIFVFFGSCIDNPSVTKKIKLLKFDKTGAIDSSYFRQQKILKGVSCFYAGETMMFSSNDGKELFACLGQEKDKIFVISDTELVQISVPYLKSIPVASIYFHNYDSIFVFFDRIFVVRNSTQKHRFSDFILIDTSGKILDRYSLDDIPFIYKGSLSPMIMLRKLSVKHKRIKGHHFYLPFLIYRPDISDSLLKNYSIKLVCDYDLNRHKSKMLDIKIPAKDIGKYFNDYVLTNSLDVYIESDTSLLYSFLYSSDIYRYSLSDEKSSLISSFPDFPFNNYDSSKYGAMFLAPEYSVEENIYLRKIYIRNLDRSKDFFMSQILDKGLKLIAYSMPDSVNQALKLNAKGNLVLKKHKNNIYELVTIRGDYDFVNLKIVKSQLPEKESSTKVVSSFMIDKNKIDYKVRLHLYLMQLGLDTAEKVVLINSEVLCSECIHFLMSRLKYDEKQLMRNKVVFLFFGENKEAIKSILKNYDVKYSGIAEFDNSRYKIYLKDNEISINPFVVLRNKKIKVFKYNPDEIENVYYDFLKY